MNRNRQPGRQFAETYFGGCTAHTAAAEALYRALEELRHADTQLQPEATVAEAVMGSPDEPRPESVFADAQKTTDLLGVVEKVVAADWPYDSPQDAFRDVVARRVMESLLGPAARASTWTPRTVWVRSVRAIVNERVRHAGGCSCPTVKAAT